MSKTEDTGSKSVSVLYLDAKDFVMESIRMAAENQIPDIQKGESIVVRLIESLNEGNELIKVATDRELEFMIATHSVNLAVFGITLARTLEHSEVMLCRIGLAALLHEIGVTRLPKKLTYQKEQLSSADLVEMRKRPIYSAQCLQRVGSEYSWLPEIISQVYERENGRGYPYGLTANDILEESKILGITDLFDACIHDRPHRRPLTGYQALLELTTDTTRPFPNRITKALIRSFTVYPYNEYVVLNTGQIGKVTEINSGNLCRPMVEIIYDHEGRKLEESRMVDLAKDSLIHVSKAITSRSLP